MSYTIEFCSGETQKVDGMPSERSSAEHNSSDILYILKDGDLRQNIAEKNKYLTFRRVDRLIKKTSWYDQEEYYYGFTKADILHAEFYDYPLVYNNRPPIPSGLYYQNGDYSDPVFEDGVLIFGEETYNHKKPGKEGDIMCGLASNTEQGPRYTQWFYCGMPFYYFWLLIQFGRDYYVFKGMTDEQIMKRLYDPEARFGSETILQELFKKVPQNTYLFLRKTQ